MSLHTNDLEVEGISMKVAIVQQRIYSGNIKKNFENIKQTIETWKDKADLIVFPEMAVSGYFIGDRYTNKDLEKELLELNEAIRELSQGTAVIWGSIHKNESKLYNAAYFAIDGAWAKRESGKDDGLYTKHLLPTYSVFDDARYFEVGNGNFEPFIFNNKKISIQVCEDLWDEGYDVSPTKEMLKYQPDVMINISTSPWTKTKDNARLEAIKRHEFDIPFVYVNATGMQNNGKNVMVFDGGSLVVKEDTIYKLPNNFESTVELVDLDSFQNHDSKVENKLYQAILKGIEYFDEESLPYKPKWIVGVSGGLDSSVTVALLTKALGKERVLGVTMPSRFTRDITKTNAYHLKEKLGIDFKEIPIGDMVDASVASLPYDKVEGLSYENIQARLRGHTLMSVASLENGVVSNNGNKIEVAFGYATLYGDAIGALGILGDLSKMEVGMIAECLNKDDEIVPSNLIPKVLDHEVAWGFAPSAELAQDQFDPMKWGYHDTLVDYLNHNQLSELLEMYRSGDIYNHELGSMLKTYGLDKGEAFIKDLRWVLRTINTATYKRIQMPPILTVSEDAYGTGLRESQLPSYINEENENLMADIENN